MTYSLTLYDETLTFALGRYTEWFGAAGATYDSDASVIVTKGFSGGIVLVAMHEG